MHYIVVSDIFGKTPALEATTRAIAESAEIIDPYQGVYRPFESEAEAYPYFSTHVGIDAYASTLDKRLKQFTQPVTLIGFSVGASALWRVSQFGSNYSVVKGYGFYGGQIRHDTEICPQFDIELIFPAHENHFSVTQVIRQLADKPKTCIHQVEYLHGFMNPLSSNYSQDGYDYWTKQLRARC